MGPCGSKSIVLLFNKELNSRIQELNTEFKNLGKMKKETIERDREKIGRISENALANIGDMASVENADILMGIKSQINCQEIRDQETREKFKKFMINFTKKSFQKMRHEIIRKSGDIGVLSCKAFQKEMGNFKEEIIIESFEELQKEAISKTLTEVMDKVGMNVLEEFLEELFPKTFKEFQVMFPEISVEEVARTMENEIENRLDDSQITFEQAIMRADYWQAEEIDCDINPITGLEASSYNCTCNGKYQNQ